MTVLEAMQCGDLDLDENTGAMVVKLQTSDRGETALVKMKDRKENRGAHLRIKEHLKAPPKMYIQTGQSRLIII